MLVEIDAHTVPDFKAPIYGIMQYKELYHAGTFCSKTALYMYLVYLVLKTGKFQD